MRTFCLIVIMLASMASCSHLRNLEAKLAPDVADRPSSPFMFKDR
jgi:hypothetical protein